MHILAAVDYTIEDWLTVSTNIVLCRGSLLQLVLQYIFYDIYKTSYQDLLPQRILRFRVFLSLEINDIRLLLLLTYCAVRHAEQYSQRPILLTNAEIGAWIGNYIHI